MERDHGPPAEGATSLHTTRWTIVMRAGRCYMFARRRPHSPDDAQDLIQGFFLHLLERRALAGVFLAPVNSIAPPSCEKVASRLGISTDARDTAVGIDSNRIRTAIRWGSSNPSVSRSKSLSQTWLWPSLGGRSRSPAPSKRLVGNTTMNLQKFDDGWKVVAAHSSTAER